MHFFRSTPNKKSAIIFSQIRVLPRPQVCCQACDLETTITDSMAPPTATATILVLFDSTASSAIMIPFTFKITLMTGSAERRVSGRGIYKRYTYTITVATDTAWINSMITRVIPLAVMTEDGRRPAVCGMTAIALYIGA